MSEPRFCALCGLNEAEYMACEDTDCGPLMNSLELAILRDFEFYFYADSSSPFFGGMVATNLRLP